MHGALQSSHVPAGHDLRWGCSCHLWAFPLACGMYITGWNLWSLFWVPCIALGVISVETQRFEGMKSLVPALGGSQGTAQGPGVLQAQM